MDSVHIIILLALILAVAIVIVSLRSKKPRKPLQYEDPVPEGGSSPLPEPVEPTPAEPASAESPKAEARPEPEVPAPPKASDDERKKRVLRLKQGLTTTRQGFIAKLGRFFKEKRKIDPSVLQELEELLITSDVGVKTTELLLGWLKENTDRIEAAGDVYPMLQVEIEALLHVEIASWDVTRAKPFCIMMVGVNGTGKTTTIGKLASQIKDQGHTVLLAAGDTFRAAAVAQLEIWGKRVGAEVVKGKEGADPSSVIFDAIKKAQNDGIDVVIADTAGRLHTKVPLMEEIKKVRRVMAKAMEGSPHEVLLVLDATTGQNAVAQTRMFKEALDISGLVLTKMDGTAKGGIIIGIVNEEKIPVRFIGIGEKMDDLRVFDAGEFVEAIFEREEEGKEAAA